eukprot:scaffold44443_cov21-Tisochrysis_lutea.AAC.2
MKVGIVLSFGGCLTCGWAHICYMGSGEQHMPATGCMRKCQIEQAAVSMMALALLPVLLAALN